MSATINLSATDRAILLNVLRENVPPEVGVWVFGSRVNGTARRYSDLDLALEGKAALDQDMLARLRDALSESDLTIEVDVLDLQAVDPAFRRIIEARMVRLPLSGGSGPAG